MQSSFWTYLKMGQQHIADWEAYDHMLFLIALCAIFSIKHWKPLLLLVTGFTIGHSLTLALAGLDIIRFPRDIIELLIPITIIVTACYNIRRGPMEKHENLSIGHYVLAVGFGLIHGMGFSNFLRSMRMPGEDSSMIEQLLAFNIGIEIGQLFIVVGILTFSGIAIDLFGSSRRLWNRILSIGAILVSLYLLYGIVNS